MALMGLDVGTTGCKAVVYDTEGNIKTTQYCEYPTITDNGRYEIDPNRIWESVCTVMKAAAQHTSEKVQAVGISAFGESAVPVDRKGNVLSNAMLYIDPRGIQECKLMEAYQEETRLFPHSMYTISKILWQRKHNPEIFSRVWKYLLMEDYIIWKLTGECRISYSEASRTGCFDVEKKVFSSSLLSQAGLGAELFSDPVPSGAICGKVRGIPELDGIAVVTGGHDQVCSALGAGAARPGEAVCGIGTVECISTIFDRLPDNRAMITDGYCCTPYAAEGSYITCAYNYTGGALLKWFRDKLAERNDPDLYADYDRKIENRQTDLLLLPYFAGAATPYMDVNAKGAILGLQMDTDKYDIYRAILEGCSFEMLTNIRRLEEYGIPIHEMTATGGGAASPVWLQIKADIFGIPLRSLKNKEAGTAGGAMLAGVASGVFRDLGEAGEKFVSTKQVYYPNPEKRAWYAEKFERYSRIYRAIRDI